MSASESILEILVAAIGRDLDGDVISIDADLYRQSLELIRALEGDWRVILLGLPDRLPAEKLLYRPHLWFHLHTERLWDRESRLYACDCAERALGFYEMEQRSGTQLADVLQVARRHAGGKPTRRLEQARDVAEVAARGIWGPFAQAQAAVWAAKAVARAAADRADDAAWGAAELAARAAETAAESARTREVERRAQWTMLVERLERVSSPNRR
ncbi:MAG: hypothetical protein AAFV53_12570 [Myxococcota bacterium]